MQTKYIFVTGGVTSSLGKGIFSASLGLLLRSRGLRVTIQKFDPYINVDPGTMNPYEHGEVYVTDDSAETDLDLGHYERFLNVRMSKLNNVTTGQVYQAVIDRERAGAYLGKTVQVVPHIIDEIKERMRRLANAGEYDVVITEIGGTVGDIESQPYVEAIRQMKFELGPEHSVVMHLTLVPYLAAAGELKTKPTQHSVKILLSHGLQPDVLVCRSERPLTQDVRNKLALFCNVAKEAVVAAPDAETIYEVPLLLQEQGIDDRAIERLKLAEKLDAEGRSLKAAELEGWIDFLKRLKNPRKVVKVALVGKYVEHQDAYKSITESFIIAGAAHNVSVDAKMILSDELTSENVASKLEGVSAILVAPGFGDRGIEGKVQAVQYARENDIPFLGICLGLQCAVVEFARNVCGMDGANSTEFDRETDYPVIDMMEDQKTITDKGGTMRLGEYRCVISDGSRIHEAYQKDHTDERHRHRFEVNNQLRYRLKENGMLFTGMNPDRDLVEVVELPEHRWFVGVQFHPEYKTSVREPHPLFVAFMGAAVAFAEERGELSDPVARTRPRPVQLASSSL